MNYFIFEKLDKERGEYASISKEEFIDAFEFSDDIVSQFEDYVKLKTQRDIVFIAYKEEIELYLKATLAQQLYGSSAFQEIINKNDSAIKKIMELEFSDVEVHESESE